VDKLKSLTDIIYQYKDTNFSWGDLDCCIFTVKVVEEFTGRKLPFWRDVIFYNDYKGAMKALRKLNCKNLKDLPSVILGNPKKDIKDVKLGEPVLYINEDNVAILGVCNGVRAYFLQDGGGLTARPISNCECCWSIN
jgi:hypothetical protein